MPWASFSMLDCPGGTGGKASAKTQVSLTRFLQSEVKIIHIIVQNNTYYQLFYFSTNKSTRKQNCKKEKEKKMKSSKRAEARSNHTLVPRLSSDNFARVLIRISM